MSEDNYIYSVIVLSRYDKGAIPMKSQQYCHPNYINIMAKGLNSYNSLPLDEDLQAD